jgi:predicted ATPase/DNA-binding winged helix-turn-helix (wHTH) protein
MAIASGTNGEDGSKRRGWCFAQGERLFRLFPERRELLNGETRVALGPRPFDLLVYMVEHPGRIIPRSELLETVWAGCNATEGAISTQISAVRDVIGTESIKSVNNKGYQFTLDVEPIDMAPPAPPTRQSSVTLPPLPRNGVGRDAELANLAALGTEHRLVTVVGPGGVGKTWLALTLGWRSVESFPDGVHFVDLGPVKEKLAVAGTVAQALGISLRRGDDPTRLLAAVIGERRMLLLFDSCEYATKAARELIKGLLTLAPNLSVLATSQEPLRLPMEMVFPLGPLPPADAEALFVRCVLAAGRRLSQNEPATAAAVAEICRRLDGIPLALEMAAAQVPALGIEGVRDGVGQQRFDMLDRSKGSGEGRQATLTAMVEWSHGLLDEADQEMFRRLGLFRGSFTREATIAVAGREGANEWDVTASLGRLVDNSLLVAEEGGRPRYRMLETLRLFATARLDEARESDVIAERYARFYAGLFEHADLAWETMADAEWTAVYGADIDNLRAALDWALAESTRATMALSLAGAGGHLWVRLALSAEGRNYLDRVMALIDAGTPPADAARVIRRAAVMWRRTDRQRAVALMERAVALYRQTDDRLNFGATLGALGGDYTFLGRYADAKAALDEARELLADSSHMKSLFSVMNELGTNAQLANDLDQAIRYFNTARDLARQLKDVLREGITVFNIGGVDFGLGAMDRAIAHARESAGMLRAEGCFPYLGWPLVNLASYLAVQDRQAEARDIAVEALSIVRQEGGHWLRLCLQLWSLIGAQEGRYVEAAQLLGFVDAGYKNSGEIREPVEQRIYKAVSRLVAANLTAEDIQAWAEEGARWDEERAFTITMARLVSPEK